MIHQFFKVLVVLLGTIGCFAQTNYVFIGTGNWDDTTQWEDGRYPGATIDTDEVVTVQGDVTIPEEFTVTVTGENEFTVASGGTIRNSGTFTLDEGLSNSGTIRNLDGGALNSFKITNRGTIRNAGDILVSELINFSFFTNNKTVNTRVQAEVINRNGATFLNNKDIIISSESTVRIGGAFINGTKGFLEVSGFMVLESQSFFRNQGNLDLVDSGNLSLETDWVNQGLIRILHTNSRIQTQTYSFSNFGTIENQGEIQNLTGTFTNKENAMVINNNLISSASDNRNFSNEGVLGGINVGHTGEIFTTGRIAPGNAESPIGTYRFTDEWIQAETAQVEIQIASDTEADRVQSDKNITLSGVLEVQYVDGLDDLDVGSEYVIVSGNQINGTFTTATFPELSANKMFELTYTETEVRLSVIALRVPVVYTFIGEGEWTDVSQWAGNRYPGTTILERDTVKLRGNVVIPEGIDLVNEGTLIARTASKNQQTTVNGSIVNNGFMNLRFIELTNNGTFSNTSEILLWESTTINTGLFTNNGILKRAGIQTDIINTGTFENEVNGVLSEDRDRNFINQNILINRGTFRTQITNERTFTNSGEFNVLQFRDTPNAETINSGTFRINDGQGVTVKGSVTNEAEGTVFVGRPLGLSLDSGSSFSNLGMVTTGGSGEITIGSDFLNRGIITSDGNVTVTFGNLTNEKTILSRGSLSIETGGVFTNDENGTTTIFEDARSATRGRMMVEGDLLNLGVFDNEGQIKIRSASNSLNSGLLINRGELEIQPEGFFVNTSRGTFENYDVFIDNSSGSAFVNNGLLTGSNGEHQGNAFINSGQFSPGRNTNSIGSYEIETDFQQNSNGELIIDLDRGGREDIIRVEGDVTLGGTLTVRIDEDLSFFSLGTSFFFLFAETRGSSITGTFDKVNIPAIGSGKKLEVVYFENRVFLEVVADQPAAKTLTDTTSELTVYPTQTKTYLNVQGIEENTGIEIYNSMGKRVQSQNSANDSNTQLDVSTLKTGIYILKADGQTQRFIKI